MAKRQAGENRRADLGAQPVGHRGQAKAPVVTGNQFVAGELAHQNRFLPAQNARVQQLGQHALNPVRMLAYIFQEQNPAFDRREIRSTQQPAQHGQISTPEPSGGVPAAGLGLGSGQAPARALALAL